MYKRINDGTEASVYVLDESFILEVDKKKCVNFVPAVVKADPQTGKVIASSYVMMQSRKTIDNAMKELGRYGFSFRNASVFSRKISSLAVMLQKFEPFFKNEGNQPMVELIDGKGEKKSFNLLDVIKKPCIFKSIDWKKSAQYYKNREIRIETKAVKSLKFKKKNTELYDIKLPEAFVVSVKGLKEQRDGFASFLRGQSSKEYETFLFEISEDDRNRNKRPKHREEIRRRGSRFIRSVRERGY